MKEKIKHLLQRINYYHYIKFSLFFEAYQMLFKRNLIRHKKRELRFYKSFLPDCNLIFDIGAYDGHKTEIFRKIAQKVVCCEPDKNNFSLLRIRFRSRKKNIMLENKSVGSQIGLGDYYINSDGSAFNTLSDKFKKFAEKEGVNKWSEEVLFTRKEIIEITTLDSLIEKYGRPDFIKIDTEGYELEVIRGLSQPVRYLSFECIYPEFKEELYQILDRLEKLCPHTMVFNLSYEEELLLDEFTAKDGLLQLIELRQFPYFEVVACCDLS